MNIAYNDKLFERTVFGNIKPYLDTSDIIVLHGARQVGKTSLMRFIEQYYCAQGMPTYFIDLEDSRVVSLLNNGIDVFLTYLKENGVEFNKGFTVVFIDEIQYLENPSSFLKTIADHHKYLKLIVSGSSSFNIKKKFRTALVGRTVNFEVWPLSFKEMLYFTKSPVNLPLSHNVTGPLRDTLVEKYNEYCLYGGYPRIILTADRSMKEKYLQQIIDTYIRKDIRDIGNIRDIQKFNALLEALASQSGNMLNVKELSNTCDLSAQTVECYLFLLEETYIISRVRPWSKNKRTELFKTPKIFFIDTGIMQLLWLKSFQREIIGNVFETSIYSELMKHFGRSALYYWRTKDKKEIDFILASEGKLSAIEAKLHFAKHQMKPFKVFEKRYQPIDTKCIAIRGLPLRNIDKYPWELYG